MEREEGESRAEKMTMKKLKRTTEQGHRNGGCPPRAWVARVGGGPPQPVTASSQNSPLYDGFLPDRIMDGSRVTQSLDSLWFYTNILTCRYEPAASLTDQSAPSIHPPKRYLQKPNTPLFLLNQHCESQSQNVENMIPMCHKCGESSPAFEEMVRKSGRETEKRERKMRRKWSKFGLNGTEVILGGLDLGFNVKEVGGFLRFQEESCNKYQMLGTQQQTKMPPFDDDVAMKQHLKSWAYAVACTVK